MPVDDWADDGRIHAKVARVLNSTDLALNRGSDAGIQVGARFAILSDRGMDITDPDTGETLDSVEIAKTLVKVISVTPKLCVARTFRSYESFGLADTLFRNSLGGGTRHETLRSDEATAQQELDPSQAKVKVGDQAVQYSGEWEGIAYDF